ncbi:MULTISPECIES: leucine-rich repeat protein [Clostridium]|uniref:leucine-rich repeat protein n=1 Tax=Clostridium TaxID=1485 RepID=UPI000825A86D|nr:MULTISPECIES: leucine-rich repeat protein [Clostridium]PJI08172.1 hypothetical protein CUB90_09980 [Clostridium sp. CT7]
MKKRKTKFMSLLIILISLFVNVNSITAVAVTSGVDANGFTWQSDDGVNYSITGYNGSDTNITIPSSIDGHTVTSIANNAFNGNNTTKYQTLTSVTIPDTVTSIGGFAFYYCSSLVSISIPNSVTSIGDSAFAYCMSLPNITLPTNLSSIGNSTFQDCKAFSSITIPSSVTSIGTYAFFECISLTNITIPSGVTYIGEGAFKDCKALTSAVMPDTVTSIGNYLFYNCQLLSNVKLSNNLTDTGSFIFYNCFSLTGVTLPSNLTNIGNSAFENCTALANIVIPEGVTRIGYRAFIMCKVLSNVTIPNTVKIIDFNAFAHCYAFTNIIIPDSVTSIGDYAFYYCTSLTEITIPQSVTNIGFLTFDSCNPAFIMKGFGGSYAQVYAGSNSIAFEELLAVKYTATFNSEGGSTVGSVQVDNNALISEPISPIKAGYIFGGWYKDISFNTLWDFTNDRVTDNVTLFAKWIDRVVTNITMNTSPTKTSYIQGQSLDVTGAKIVAAYNDGTNETVNVTPEMVSGYNANQAGIQTITVNYNGKVATFTVDVIAKVLTNITMNTSPTKTSYIQGQSLDVTGAKIVAAYNDGTNETVNVTSGMVSGYNANQVGTQIVTVNYNGKVATFTVNVIAKALTNITMNTPPTKTSYIQGQGLDVTGAKIVAAYNDGTNETVNVTPEMVSGYNANQAGTQTITVNYNGKITTFTVDVIAKALTNITMNTPPTKTSYIQGQSLDLTGAKIIAAYNDGTNETVNVTPEMVSGYNANQAGTQTITVNYNGKVATFTVNVVAKALTNVTMNTPPTKTSYIQGQSLDVTGAKIVATYNDGTTEIVNVTSEMVSGYNANQAGTQTITVNYNGKVATFTVNVIATYTVMFNSNGGTTVANKVVPYNDLVSAPANPTRVGYTFLAWYKESTFVTRWDFTIDKVTKDTTLYAKWAQNPVAPITITKSKPSATSAKINWNKVTGVSGYEVWRASSNASAYTYIATLTETSYTDTALTEGKTYYYRIRSYKIVDGIKVYSGYTNKIVFVKIQ